VRNTSGSFLARARFAAAVALLACGSLTGQSAQGKDDLNVRRDADGKILTSAQQSSPSGMIQAATRAGAPAQTNGFSPVDVLTDTQGVDFRPYLNSNVLPTIRNNWYALIPFSAQTKKGKLAIEFAIQKNGQVSGMKLVASSGDLSLDRAAWGGIIASNPFAPLPSEFKGEYLSLRFRFYYNPDKADIEDAKSTAPVIAHARLEDRVFDSHLPKYPKKARQAKVEGVVRLDAGIGTNGKVTNLKVLEGDAMLADAAVHAIRKWRFLPAQKNGKPVEDQARIRVDFRLDGESVRAQVVSYRDPMSSPAQ
jgi:TonB family protein